MAIVMISSFAHSGQDEVASMLAEKTGWPLLARNELLDLAREQGVKTGRLEVSAMNRLTSPERLAREKNLYLAFVTAALCDKTADGNLIYSGRCGHLLLPGLCHRLRVRVTLPRETRIQRAAHALDISPEKADSYLRQLDEDYQQWARWVHRVEFSDPGYFDMVLNLENIGLTNAAAMLCETAILTDFRPTPASRKRFYDLKLAAVAKLRLALDPRTAAADLQVQADSGVVTVTYPPHQEEPAAQIAAVLTGLDGCREIQCTLAETSVLWVQERFSPQTETFEQITSLAKRWGAAIELMRLVPPEERSAEMARAEVAEQRARARVSAATAANGGVEDDEPEPPVEDGGLSHTQEELISLGRSGGQRTVCGGCDEIVVSSEGYGKYSLVVIGEVFLTKDPSARKRMTRELALSIRDRLKAPVVTADELVSKLAISGQQAVKAVAFSVLVVLAYVLVLAHQPRVLDLLGGELHEQRRWLAPLLVVVFVPLLAYLYGQVTAFALRLMRID